MDPQNDYLPHVYREPLWSYPAVPHATEPRIIVEVGPGRGDFLFYLAQKNPQALVCGIELMHERFEMMIPRRDRQGLENVWLLQGDARRVLPEIFDAGVHEIHIHFSDPWPKRKHQKHRLMQTPFIAACAKTLLPGGHLYFTTDWKDYSDWTAKLMAQFCHPTACHPDASRCHPERSEGSRFSDSSAAPQNDKMFASVYDPVIQINLEDVFPSYFCQKWLARGRVIQCQKYLRLSD